VTRRETGEMGTEWNGSARPSKSLTVGAHSFPRVGAVATGQSWFSSCVLYPGSCTYLKRLAGGNCGQLVQTAEGKLVVMLGDTYSVYMHVYTTSGI